MLETEDGVINRMDGLEEDAPEADPERAMWNRQLSGKIEEGLRGLTPRERMVFELRHYHGMRLRHIGEVLGTSEEAAKNCLFRATQKMRGALGEFV
jgi:RNA polymerase sigma-70 factor (ECF subfamily)